jgi:DNA polymerase I
LPARDQQTHLEKIGRFKQPAPRLCTSVCILAERRGLPIVAPIHDAFMVEAAAADIEDVLRELDRAMGDASALVLGGYRLPTDPGTGPILPGQRFYDKNGEAMWTRINQLIDGLERRTA